MYSTRRRNEPGLPVMVYVMAFLVIIGGSVAISAASYGNPQTMTCTVEDKDRTSRKGSSDMRVYTEDCGVLAVQDMLFAGEFNSADTYNEIEVGETYEFETTGYRIGPLSKFPVIREVTPVEG